MVLKEQITYLQDQANLNFSEIYAVDLTCFTRKEACFGESYLLLKSLPMPTSQDGILKGLISDYDWSPDGGALILISGGDILYGDIKSQNWINLTKTPEIDEYSPRWSSDGKYIYYLSCPEVSGVKLCHLDRMDASGENAMILFNPIGGIINYAVSPNQQMIVFSQPSGFGPDRLYQMHLDRSAMRQITKGNFSEYSPSFSSNGKKIVFIRSNEYSSDIASKVQIDIIIMDLASGDENNLTTNYRDEPYSPVFSPDGQWVAFYSLDKNYNKMVFLVALDEAELIQLPINNSGAVPLWREFSEQK